MGSKLGYRERMIKEYGWDPVEPYPAAAVVGDPRAASVAVLEGLGLVRQEDGTYQDETFVAAVEPFYCLPRPVVDRGRVIGHEHTQMLVRYLRKEKGGPEAA